MVAVVKQKRVTNGSKVGDTSASEFDVVLVAPEATAVVQQLLGSAPDAAVVLSIAPSPKTRTLLRAIDKAVEQRDRNVRKMQSRT